MEKKDYKGWSFVMKYFDIFFLIAVPVGMFTAPLITYNLDSAYSFFRLMQNVPINLDDLRTINPLTILLMKAAVSMGLTAKTLSYIFSFSSIAWVYVVYVFCRYVFKYNRAVELISLILLVVTISLFNPTTSFFHGGSYFVLAYGFFRGKTNLSAIKYYSIGLSLMLLSVLVEPMWALVVVYWLIMEYITNREVKSGRVIQGVIQDCVKLKLSNLIIFSCFILGIGLLLYFVYPPLLELTSPGYIQEYGFKNAFEFWVDNSSHAYMILWVAVAYLIFKLIYRRQFAKLVTSLISLTIYVAIFGLKEGYSVYYIHSLIPATVVVTVLVLTQKNVTIFWIMGLIFYLFTLVDSINNLKNKEIVFDKIYAVLPEGYSKYIGYEANIKGKVAQPSGIVNIEFLNYSLIKHNQAKVVLFGLPDRARLDKYEADLRLPVTSDLSWNYTDLNQTYFKDLMPKGEVCILGPEAFPMRIVRNFSCSAEKYTRYKGSKYFFMCDGWSKTEQKQGPTLVEQRTTTRAYRGNASIYVLGNKWEGFPTKLIVEPGDSLIVSVRRYGNGILSVENLEADEYNPRTIHYHIESQEGFDPAPSSSNLNEKWDKLEIKTEIPDGINQVLIRVKTADNDSITYFDDLKVVLIRGGLELKEEYNVR